MQTLLIVQCALITRDFSPDCGGTILPRIGKGDWGGGGGWRVDCITGNKFCQITGDNDSENPREARGLNLFETRCMFSGNERPDGIFLYLATNSN